MERFTKLFFAAIFLLTISACDKKSCKNVVCPADQTCYNGKCLCYDGYEGANCTTLSSDKYTGSWYVTENCGAGVPSNFSNYTIYIQPVPAGGSYGVNTLTITPLFGVGTFYAQILNTDPNNLGTTIFIPQQYQGGLQISNSYGTYLPAGSSGGTAEIMITLNYTYGGFNYQCQETFYKQ